MEEKVMKSEKETIEQYLARGGQIKQLPAAKPPRTYHRTHSNNTRLDQAVKELWKGNFLDAISLAQ